MEVYFVRHGETEGNRRHIHQSPDTPLNGTGRKQARAVAKRLRAEDFTHILTSTFLRARETADIINEELHLPIIEDALFTEIHRAQYIIGRHHFSFASIWYMAKWFLERDDIIQSDIAGESHKVFLNRVIAAREKLEIYPADAKILVVSHSVFINFFVDHICNDRPIPRWKALILLLKIKNLDNSSIARVRHNADATPGTCDWELIEFDDDSHVVT